MLAVAEKGGPESIKACSAISESTDATRAEGVRKEGGLIAWLQVFGCWLLFMNTWYVLAVTCSRTAKKWANVTTERGLTNSFSIFETYYAETKFPHIHPSQISWIGSVQLFLTLFVGIFAGWILDAGYLRTVLSTGATLIFLGMTMTSICKEYWQVLLAQGICVGVGCGTLAFTSASIIPFYFTKRKMLVAGIVSTGSSVGEYSLCSPLDELAGAERSLANRLPSRHCIPSHAP